MNMGIYRYIMNMSRVVGATPLHPWRPSLEDTGSSLEMALPALTVCRVITDWPQDHCDRNMGEGLLWPSYLYGTSVRTQVYLTVILTFHLGGGLIWTIITCSSVNSRKLFTTLIKKYQKGLLTLPSPGVTGRIWGQGHFTYRLRAVSPKATQPPLGISCVR